MDAIVDITHGFNCLYS
ncbi:CRISPR-associated DxTHG motif protein [Methanosarcina barkeri]